MSYHSQNYGSSYGPSSQHYNGYERSSPYGRPEGGSGDHYDTRNSQYQHDSRGPGPEPHPGAEQHYDRGGYDSRAPPPTDRYRRGSSPPGRHPPPPSGSDYYAGGYDANRQHQGNYPPPQYPQSSYSYGSGTPEHGYPPPGTGYPPPNSEYASAGGYPPPSSGYSAPGYQHHSYPPPAYPPNPPEGYPGAAPNGSDAAHSRPADPYAGHYQGHYGAPYAPYGHPPPVYGAPPPPPPGYGPPPPGYGAPPPHPGYGPAPLGYGPPPAGYPPPMPPRRNSPRRDYRGYSDTSSGPSKQREYGRRGGKGEKGGKRGDKGKGDRGDRDDTTRKPVTLTAANAKSRLQQWLQNHQEWTAVWLEGIDPPKKPANTPNVTILMLVNSSFKNGDGEKFGFILSASHIATKKKERENDCAKELVSTLEQLRLDDSRSWCQMPDAGEAKREVDPADLERLATSVNRQCPNTTVEWADATQCVLVAALPWGPNERSSEPELAILDKFDAGFGELFQEARRVSGLVRKQWFLAIVMAKPEPKENTRPFALGIGFATDQNLAKARAVHSAEMRVPILGDAMFTKTSAQKSS